MKREPEKGRKEGGRTDYVDNFSQFSASQFSASQFSLFSNEFGPRSSFAS